MPSQPQKEVKIAWSDLQSHPCPITLPTVASPYCGSLSPLCLLGLPEVLLCFRLHCDFSLTKISRDFWGGPVVKTELSMQRVWVWFQLGELGFHILCSATSKQNTCLKDTIKSKQKELLAPVHWWFQMCLTSCSKDFVLIHWEHLVCLLSLGGTLCNCSMPASIRRISYWWHKCSNW